MRSATKEPVLYGMDACMEDVDVILSEIEAAGYSLVATDRLERLTQAGWCYRRVWIDECDGDMECAEGNAGLHPGDLEGTS